ncbi:hypothetical protein JYK18_39890 [Amycolatopsis sp. 195334CR]|nr:hypothetical protein [Amycolatopsis sp. 195334CR]
MSSFSTGTEPDIESALIDLDAVPFTALRELDEDALHHSVQHVVDRTTRLRARYRSGAGGSGERID